MARIYELVVFTASVQPYAAPLMKKLDPNRHCSALLCREHCTQQGAIYVKDMSKLGRNLEDIILLDNSPNSYYYQPENALPIENWYDSPTDRELYNYCEFLEALAFVPDVRTYLPKINKNDKFDYQKSKEIAKQLFNSSTPKTSSTSKTHKTSYPPRTPTRSSSSIQKPYERHRTIQSLDTFSVTPEINSIQASISSLKETMLNHTPKYQKSSFKAHTPVSQKTHAYTKSTFFP